MTPLTNKVICPCGMEGYERNGGKNKAQCYLSQGTGLQLKISIPKRYVMWKSH